MLRGALTEQVLGADRGEALLRATQALADLDLAAARAEHADRLSAKAPRLFRVDNETSGNDAAGNEARDSAALRLPGMQHPLLLQPRLPALPRGGKVGEDEEVDGWESGDDSEKAQEASEDEALEVTTPRVRTRAEATDVVPVDFCPPPDTRLVAITGPNTGGKTASLKALGLALLMARAGLHLPTNARETAAVPWTSRVLADPGDAQSLDLGGLSTFSAHLTRLRASPPRGTRATPWWSCWTSRAAVRTPRGAALAAAVLRASAERSTPRW